MEEIPGIQQILLAELAQNFKTRTGTLPKKKITCKNSNLFNDGRL